MKPKILTAAFVAVATLASSGYYTAVAEPPPDQPATQNQGSLSGQDRLFINQAAQIGIAKVQLSQLALERSSDPKVKEYAQLATEQYQQVNNELRLLAASKGVDLPTEMDAKYKEIDAQMRQLSSSNFDRSYLKAMEEAQAKSTLVFELQTSQGQDPDMKAFASKTIPAIRQFYQMASNMV